MIRRTLGRRLAPSRRIAARARIAKVGSVQAAGEKVFPDDEDAFKYMVAIAKRDLEYRGFRENRTSCFEYKQDANCHDDLALVLACTLDRRKDVA